MIMVKFLTEDKNLSAMLSELLSEIPAAKELDISVAVEAREEKGFTVVKEGGKWKISCSDRASLCRAAAVVAEKASKGETGEVSESPLFETLGAMIDMSGNAVMKPSAVKRFCRMLAVLGYNTLVFKTVNGACLSADIDLEGFAGRYTADELKELDVYAAELGITLTPCIQFSEMPAFDSVADFAAALDNLLLICSENLGGRKICLGFDRPALPGCGPYPKPCGNCPEDKLGEYMQAASELCAKYGYETTVGSGVLDVTENEHGVTYAVSECTNVNPNHYREILGALREKTENAGFVGGDNGWYGAVPLSWLSHTVACATLPALKEFAPKEVYVAMWREDTGACSYFATLPVLFAYAETCYARTDYTEHLSARMLALCGVDFYDMVPLEDIPAIRCRLNTGRNIVNPAKYMLYDKVIGGAFDAHSSGGVTHLKNMTVWMAERIERAGEFAYIFEEQVAFCNLLACKADINETLRRAFRKGMPDTVRHVYDEHFDKAIDAVDLFLEKIRAQWDRECMDFGMELIEERMELVKHRIEEGRPILGAYLAGEIEQIDCLVGTPEPYCRESELLHDMSAILINDFDMIIKGNS